MHRDGIRRGPLLDAEGGIQPKRESLLAAADGDAHERTVETVQPPGRRACLLERCACCPAGDAHAQRERLREGEADGEVVGKGVVGDDLGGASAADMGREDG